MMILGIDPGPEQSGWLCYVPGDVQPIRAGNIDPNTVILERIRTGFYDVPWCDHVVIEDVRPYIRTRNPVGNSIFGTLRWLSRFQEAFDSRDYRGTIGWESRVVLMPRQTVRCRLCTGRFKGGNAPIRKALLQRFGKEALAGITDHLWSALALAVTLDEQAQAGPLFVEARRARRRTERDLGWITARSKA